MMYMFCMYIRLYGRVQKHIYNYQLLIEIIFGSAKILVYEKMI